MSRPDIPGYTFGSSAVAKSPMSDEDFAVLKQTVLLGDTDLVALRQAGEVLADQVEAILDVWYGFVGSHPHLVHYFSGANGQPDPAYLAGVRRRFGQWITDTCAARYDRDWLDYQYEIGLRHTSAKKGKTDGVNSAATSIHLRYLIAFIVPITATIKPFLAKKGHSAEQVEAMHAAWFKSITLQVTLWSEPYVAPSTF
ncbi:MAG: protoglobin domain-containing protein [Moraxellaceae bacterium]|nr:protoglobin domain-containing protein [Moraxellaceae bacterium]